MQGVILCLAILAFSGALSFPAKPARENDLSTETPPPLPSEATTPGPDKTTEAGTINASTVVPEGTTVRPTVEGTLPTTSTVQVSKPGIIVSRPNATVSVLPGGGISVSRPGQNITVSQGNITINGSKPGGKPEFVGIIETITMTRPIRPLFPMVPGMPFLKNRLPMIPNLPMGPEFGPVSVSQGGGYSSITVGDLKVILTPENQFVVF